MSDLESRIKMLEEQVRELSQLVEHLDKRQREFERHVLPPKQLGRVYAWIRIALSKLGKM